MRERVCFYLVNGWITCFAGKWNIKLRGKLIWGQKILFIAKCSFTLASAENSCNAVWSVEILADPPSVYWSTPSLHPGERRWRKVWEGLAANVCKSNQSRYLSETKMKFKTLEDSRCVQLESNVGEKFFRIIPLKTMPQALIRRCTKDTAMHFCGNMTSCRSDEHCHFVERQARESRTAVHECVQHTLDCFLMSCHRRPSGP